MNPIENSTVLIRFCEIIFCPLKKGNTKSHIPLFEGQGEEIYIDKIKRPHII